MADTSAKKRWEQDNVMLIHLKINRNQDPELYKAFNEYPGSKGALARELLRKAVSENDPLPPDKIQ